MADRMIRRTGSWLIIPLDERGRVVLTREEFRRAMKAFHRAYHGTGKDPVGSVAATIDSLVPEITDEQE